MGKKDREAARYDPEKLRARCEEKLGAEPGSTKGLTFMVLREMVGERFPKLAHEITAMLRTGDHLVGDRCVEDSAPRCPHGKVVCRLCPHDGRPYVDSEAKVSDATLRSCGFERD